MSSINQELESITNTKIRNIIIDSIKENYVKGEALRYLLIDAEGKKIFESLCNKLNTRENIWQEATSDYWLLQIAYLHEEKRDEQAAELLKQYGNIWKKKDIHLYLSVAHLSCKIKQDNKKIRKANLLYEHMRRHSRLFWEIVKGKNIAIVGNGPSELNLKKGKEIDEHQLVVRFNNYSVEGHEQDYGKRTDIWIRGFGGDDIEDKTANNTYKYVGWVGDYRYIKIFGEENFNILYRDCCIKKIPCSFMDVDLYYETIQKCGERLPTTGCVTTYIINKYLQEEGKTLSPCDIYGFSFFQDEISVATHYFQDRDSKLDQEKTKNHNLKTESSFISNLLYKENKADTIKILVCYHKPTNLIKNNIFEPIHVGRKIAKNPSKDGINGSNAIEWLNKNMIGDDTGDNISHLNRNYCELTGLYWAWKNQNKLGYPEYLGLIHYRRVLEFKEKPEQRYLPEQKEIYENCKKYDVIVAKELSAYSVKLGMNANSIYEHFTVEHGEKYADILYRVLKRECSDKENAIEQVLFKKKKISWYNIIIARKEIFDQYCTWLFEILKQLESECRSSKIDIENSRMAGFYGEILLAIYVEWLSEYHREYRIGKLPARKVDEAQLYNFPYIPVQVSLSQRIEGWIKKRDLDLKYKNIWILYKFLRRKKRKEKIKTVEKVHSMVYRDYYPNGGAGGGGAVLSCQKQILGESYGQLPLQYSFKEKNFYTDMVNPLWDIWAAAEFAIQKSLEERSTVYIVHDYGTAFGLALLGKRYILVSHIQGSRVEEKTNFGEKFSDTDAKIINFCEKMAFENAFWVCFPSKGAYLHFENSIYRKKMKYRVGPTLYNTLYAFPKEEVVEKIPKDSNYQTYLSIGQLTVAKGIDSCVDFFQRLLKEEPQKWVKWIIVGEGILEKEIIAKCVALRNRYKHFRFSHVKKCSYSQMQYLQNVCDVYIMRQRISIFDLSTLELMNKAKPIILSYTGGNLEFNQENNIIFYNENFNELREKLTVEELKKFGRKNKEVYDKYFSNRNFLINYKYIINHMMTSDKEAAQQLELQNMIEKEMHKMKVELLIPKYEGKI